MVAANPKLELRCANERKKKVISQRKFPGTWGDKKSPLLNTSKDGSHQLRMLGNNSLSWPVITWSMFLTVILISMREVARKEEEVI